MNNPYDVEVQEGKITLDAALKRREEDKAFWGKAHEDDGYVDSMRACYNEALAAQQAWNNCATIKDHECQEKIREMQPYLNHRDDCLIYRGNYIAAIFDSEIGEKVERECNCGLAAIKAKYLGKEESR